MTREVRVAFRELAVVTVREILRRWKLGEGFRTIEAHVGVDRKTVRRYVTAARSKGLSREEGGRAVDDQLVAEVVAEITPGAPAAVGRSRQFCRDHAEQIEGWVREGCKAPKIRRLLKRHHGMAVPVRTLRRFVAEDLNVQDTGTVRVVDPPAGQMLEIDFMEVGKVLVGGQAVKLHALVAVAAYSRLHFVWPCLSQDRQQLIDALEACWDFFGGVFPVVVFDNPKTAVSKADPLDPELSEAFLEYAQDRGFKLDLARVRRPRDKPKVERMVSYTRSDCFAGERFTNLDHARRHSRDWCWDVAGHRIHGTTRREPAVVFEEEEQGLLLAAPQAPYDQPRWTTVKVGQDHAVAVAEALYSVPSEVRNRQLRIRYDRKVVKFYDGRKLVKVHPRVPRGTSQIDPADLPDGLAELAMRDGESLHARAARLGPAIGTYAERILDGDLPWTRMRHVYRLLGLCRQYGASTVDAACRKALDLDVVDVTRVARMLEKGLEGRRPTPPPPSGGSSNVIELKFARDPNEFRARRPGDPDAS
jgi:transposase